MLGLQNLSGQSLGQYELHELLGMGGMGAVYVGYQKALDRKVAVKILNVSLGTGNDYVERFTREAKTSAALEHAHIVPVYDYGTQQGVSYVVMRLLTGGSLAERIEHSKDTGRPLPSLTETATILQQLGSALEYAHSRGVIHRDIKTNNVMFDEQGSAFLVDFGIAKLSHATSALTGTGMTMGTPSYMAPELWRGDNITPAVDQYALAVMTYSMLTGRLPFEADTPYQLMSKHINDDPTPIYDYRDELLEDVNDVIRKALSKNPQERYLSVMGFVKDFEEACKAHKVMHTGFFVTPLPHRAMIASDLENEPTTQGAIMQPGTEPDNKTVRLSTGEQAAQGGSKSRLPLMIAGGVLALILAGGAFAFLGGNRLSGEEQAGTQTQAAFLLLPTSTDTPTATETNTATMTPTDTFTPTFTDTPSDTPTATASDTATPSNTATDTVTPSVTATDTPSVPVIVSARQLVARQGPGSGYPQVGTITAGDTLEITGISEDGSWYQILLSDGEVGWVVTSSAFVSVFGPLDVIEVAQAPTSTPSDTPTPTDTATETATPTFTHTPTNTATHTPTDIPTNTGTSTPTNTATKTATHTPEPTETSTNTMTASPTATPTLPPLANCPGALPSRLRPGTEGFVMDEDPRDLNVRDGAGTDFPRVDQIAPLERFTVLEGPRCADGFAWYRIRYAGVLEGWVAEADNRFYFTAPVETPPDNGNGRNLPPPTPANAMMPDCRVLIEEDFESGAPTNDWYIGRSERSEIRISEGTYQVVLGDVPGATTDPVSWGSLRGFVHEDGTVEAVIRASRFTPGEPARTGLWLRYQNENEFLAFMIRGDGSYRIATYNGDYEEIAPWTLTDALRVGDDVENTIRVTTVGNSFDLYINGRFIRSVQDSTWADGRIVFWGSSADTPVIFSMDAFRVCRD